MTLLDNRTQPNTSPGNGAYTEQAVAQADPFASCANSNPLWDVAQFAHYLNQKPEFIRQLIKQRRITVVRIGGKVMLEKSTADELIASGRRPATQPLHLDRFGHR